MEERAIESKKKLAEKQKKLCELMRTVLSYRRMLERNQRTDEKDVKVERNIKIRLPFLLASIPEGPKN
jgi:hypothetical protein